jgi:hypothetical protein
LEAWIAYMPILNIGCMAQASSLLTLCATGEGLAA